MKKIIILFLTITIFALPVKAAIDVKVQGSIYAKVVSEPGNLLQAGTRLKLYSELSKSGYSGVKVRIIGANQKVGDLNNFNASSRFNLDNLVDWVEIELNGNLFPQGPPVKLSIGNIEVDYSPYIITLKDDALSEYCSSYKNHRGIALQELNFSGIETSSFVLWGFDDPRKNTIGGKVYKKFGTTKLTGIISDYRFRTSDAESIIRNRLINNPNILFELEQEQVTGLEVEQQLGNLGILSYFVATQNQNKFQRIEDEIKQVEQISILQEAAFKMPVIKGLDLIFGYRDIPVDYDPLFRDRTVEFDEKSGHYLGYNPVDRYRNRFGMYSELKAEKDHFQLGLKISDMKNHDYLPTRFSMTELSLFGEIFSWEIDIFSFLEQEREFLNTGIGNSSEKGFARCRLTKPINIGENPIFIGGELRKNFNPLLEDFSQGILFLRYQRSDYFVLDAGIRQSLSGNAVGGNYIGFNYNAPNGLIFRYRKTFPTVVSDGKEHYDPDYRLLEPDNIAQVSVNVKF